MIQSKPVEGTPSGGGRWYVAAVHSGAEGRARAGLEREPLGFRCLLPVQRYLRAVEGVVMPVVEVSFPGYLFVFFDINRDPWRCINNTRGVIKLLPTAAEKPVPLPVPLAAGLLAESAVIDESPRPYVCGDRLEITDGHFAQRIGHVEEVLTKRNKIKVWLAAFGGFVVEVPASATRLA